MWPFSTKEESNEGTKMVPCTAKDIRGKGIAWHDTVRLGTEENGVMYKLPVCVYSNKNVHQLPYGENVCSSQFVDDVFTALAAFYGWKELPITSSIFDEDEKHIIAVPAYGKLYKLPITIDIMDVSFGYLVLCALADFYHWPVTSSEKKINYVESKED